MRTRGEPLAQRDLRFVLPFLAGRRQEPVRGEAEEFLVFDKMREVGFHVMGKAAGEKDVALKMLERPFPFEPMRS